MNAVNRHKLAVCLGMADGNFVYTGEWLNISCPYASWKHAKGTDHNPSFGIRINVSGESIYKCWSCGAIGSVSDLVFQLIHLTRKFPKPNHYDLATAMQLVANEGTDVDFVYTPVDYEDETKFIEETVFPSSWLNSFFKKYDHPYLLNRGLTAKIGKLFDVRLDVIDKRVCFPLYSFDGRLLGMQGRAYLDNPLRYRLYDFKGKFNPHIWGNEVNVNLDEPLVLTEGSFDACSIARVYENVLFSLTSSLGIQKIKRIRDASQIITFYDWGTGGDNARHKLEDFFSDTDVFIHHVYMTEEEGDAGNLTEEEVEGYLKESLFF